MSHYSNTKVTQHLSKFIYMLTLQTCKSQDVCFLTLWVKQVSLSINIFFLLVLPWKYQSQWLTQYFFQMHAWHHPGWPKICCMQQKNKAQVHYHILSVKLCKSLFIRNRIQSVKDSHPAPLPPTLVSFTRKDRTIQNAKNPKKIVRLTLIDALMCPKT